MFRLLVFAALAFVAYFLYQAYQPSPAVAPPVPSLAEVEPMREMPIESEEMAEQEHSESHPLAARDVYSEKTLLRGELRQPMVADPADQQTAESMASESDAAPSPRPEAAMPGAVEIADEVRRPPPPAQLAD